jgi:hypothetical protein
VAATLPGGVSVAKALPEESSKEPVRAAVATAAESRRRRDEADMRELLATNFGSRKFSLSCVWGRMDAKVVSETYEP